MLPTRIAALSRLVLLSLCLPPLACGGGGGGGDGGGDDGNSQAAANSINQALAEQFVAIGGYQLPADSPVDTGIVLTPPPGGVMPLSAGQTVLNQLSFTAPPGVSITGVGIRFGASGPINVTPLSNRIGFQSAEANGIFSAAIERARTTAGNEQALQSASAGLSATELPMVGSESYEALNERSILSGQGIWAMRLVDAEGGSQSNAAAQEGRDAWIRWQAPTSGTWTLVTSNSPDAATDAILTVWNTDDGRPSGTPIGWDQPDRSGRLDAGVAFVASAGATYLIQFSSQLDASNAWSGNFGIAPASSVAGAAETASYSFDVPPSICNNLASICHEIVCYEFAVTSIGTISPANIMQVALACGNCSEPSCQQLIDDCDQPASPWAGEWAGTFTGICCPDSQDQSGTWVMTVSSSGLATGLITGPGGSASLFGTVSKVGVLTANFGSGSNWSGGIGTNTNTIVGAWTQLGPPCLCFGDFYGKRQ